MPLKIGIILQCRFNSERLPGKSLMNFGRKSLNELKDNLKIMGLGFGMKLTNWPPKNLDELLKLKNKEF